MGKFQEFERAIFGRASNTSTDASADSGAPPPIGLAAVKEGKWNTRYRKFLRLAANVAVRAFGAEPFATIVLNRFTDESYYPEEQLQVVGLTLPANAAHVAIFQLTPAPAGLITVIEEIQVQRLNTAGEVDIFWNNASAGGAAANIFPIVRDSRLGIGAGTGLANASGNHLIADLVVIGAVLVPAAFVPVFTGAAVNPAILRPNWIVGDVNQNPTPFLTFQMGPMAVPLVNEGLSVTIFFRMLGA